MKFTIFIIAAAVVASVAPAYGKTYDRCSLAKEMYALGVPKSELAIWTCIAQYESTFRTDAIGTLNSNGSTDYGIFQINSKYWCKPTSGSSYNECNISCNQLLTDRINDSVTCARKILKQQGWSAWSVYKPKCSGSLTSIDSCF